jgi:hypothetical protein
MSSQSYFIYRMAFTVIRVLVIKGIQDVPAKAGQRLGLLNPDSSCKSQGLSTESELPNYLTCAEPIEAIAKFVQVFRNSSKRYG